MTTSSSLSTLNVVSTRSSPVTTGRVLLLLAIVVSFLFLYSEIDAHIQSVERPSSIFASTGAGGGQDTSAGYGYDPIRIQGNESMSKALEASLEDLLTQLQRNRWEASVAGVLDDGRGRKSAWKMPWSKTTSIDRAIQRRIIRGDSGGKGKATGGKTAPSYNSRSMGRTGKSPDDSKAGDGRRRRGIGFRSEGGEGGREELSSAATDAAAAAAELERMDAEMNLARDVTLVVCAKHTLESAPAHLDVLLATVPPAVSLLYVLPTGVSSSSSSSSAGSGSGGVNSAARAAVLQRLERERMKGRRGERGRKRVWGANAAESQERSVRVLTMDGFASGYAMRNASVEHVKTKYALFVFSDVFPATHDWLVKLHSFAELQPADSMVFVPYVWEKTYSSDYDSSEYEAEVVGPSTGPGTSANSRGSASDPSSTATLPSAPSRAVGGRVVRLRGPAKVQEGVRLLQQQSWRVERRASSDKRKAAREQHEAIRARFGRGRKGEREHEGWHLHSPVLTDLLFDDYSNDGKLYPQTQADAELAATVDPMLLLPRDTGAGIEDHCMLVRASFLQVGRRHRVQWPLDDARGQVVDLSHVVTITRLCCHLTPKLPPGWVWIGVRCWIGEVLDGFRTCRWEDGRAGHCVMVMKASVVPANRSRTMAQTNMRINS